MINLTEKQQELFECLMQIPADISSAEELLKTKDYSSKDASIVGLCFADACFFESDHSEYLYDVVKLLLCYGLDPNFIADQSNIMRALQFVQYEYAAADTLQLLIDHGGNVNLVTDDESLFDEVDFSVIFGAYEQYDRKAYDALVHLWFVMLANGGVPSNNASSVDCFKEYTEEAESPMFDITKLKNHRDYTFALSNTPSRGEKWSLHIIEKSTFWEVARL